jgi:dephospho-CoA kinase
MTTVIGLTGNIGTGKSAVLAMLRDLGADTIDADAVAHEVMRPGQPAHTGIVQTFGPDILAADGTIDRARLGAIVFRDAAALAQLEGIVHPAVFARMQALVRGSRQPVVVIEAIKLLEAGHSITLCDVIWVVTSPRDQQITRLMQSRHLSQAEAELRIDAQPPQAEKVRRADVVIDNSGTLDETRQQVESAWQRLPPST